MFNILQKITDRRRVKAEKREAYFIEQTIEQIEGALEIAEKRGGVKLSVPVHYFPNDYYDLSYRHKICNQIVSRLREKQIFVKYSDPFEVFHPFEGEPVVFLASKDSYGM